ncbi:hypothetical protein Trydic_g20446 [Trypoxylus dichotomus]
MAMFSKQLDSVNDESGHNYDGKRDEGKILNENSYVNELDWVKVEVDQEILASHEQKDSKLDLSANMSLFQVYFTLFCNMSIDKIAQYTNAKVQLDEVQEHQEISSSDQQKHLKFDLLANMSSFQYTNIKVQPDELEVVNEKIQNSTYRQRRLRFSYIPLYSITC